jgi:hypothetical protein
LRLSEDRVSHIAHRITDKLWKEDLVDFTSDEKALRSVKETLKAYLSVEDAADLAARAKIRSLSRDIPEGGREWDVLYSKYLEEALAKKNF